MLVSSAKVLREANGVTYTHPLAYFVRKFFQRSSTYLGFSALILQQQELLDSYSSFPICACFVFLFHFGENEVLCHYGQSDSSLCI